MDATSPAFHRQRPADDPAAWQKEALGNGPGLAPFPLQEMGPEALDIVQRLQAASGVPTSREIPEIVATLLRHPRLCEAHVSVGVALLGHGALTARRRELAILRTVWLCGAPFEWGEHVAIARRAGVTSEDIDRATLGGTAAAKIPRTARSSALR